MVCEGVSDCYMADQADESELVPGAGLKPTASEDEISCSSCCSSAFLS